ncbi:B12-binding domain-containing protein [Pseudopelagicola sp. nBUS_20]|uniref:cobalamin B12-binding domain-containing protein n=1 Tax=Pseudopelagicola sp. nBUS_20 TaxID=3395317 RepID=UPI003EC0489D
MSGEERLLTECVLPTPAERDIYRRSEANIRRLSEILPEDLVIDLAREVILRVASKENSLSHISYTVDEEDIKALCLAVVSDDETAGARIISDLRAVGVRPEDIYLRQLAAAARMLGEMWVKDELTFSQVTVGTGRMFAIMRSMRHLFEPSMPAQDKTAIFAAVPGEDHTLGVHMAADFFRKEGWQIALKVGMDHDQLVAEIKQAPTGIVGLSISGEHSIEALSRLVVALRITCPHAKLIVSGSNVEEVEPILSLMGLDVIAASVEDAQEQMTAMWNSD